MSASGESRVEVDVERMATGGEAVAHLDDGRVVFVGGALPGETVRVTVTEEKKRFARGFVVDVVKASPTRIDIACAHAATKECGGCDWIHIRPEAQRQYKQSLVIEQLERLGRVASPTVTTAPTAPGRRTTVRCSITNGRAGYRARRSDATFVAESCRAAHPLLEELIVDGRFGNATEVTLRVGVASGERIVVTNGDVHAVTVPEGVVVVSTENPGDAAIFEEVAGRRWRISATSFFQTSREGADSLVAAVGRSVGPTSGSIVDLYAGVGLLGGGAARERVACAVEANPASVADAKVNLGSRVQVVQSRVERWTPSSFATVIADPARRGLAAEGVAVIEGTAARHLALVSCDPASLGRDAALLGEQGWRYDRGEVIDMFPDTSRIEVVSTFVR